MAKHIFFTFKSATWKTQLFASSTILWRSRVFEATDVLRVESDVDVIVKSRRYEDFQLVLPRSIDYGRRTMLQDIYELGDAMRELRPTHVNIELLNMFCKYHEASRRGEEQQMFLKNVPLTRTFQNPLVFVNRSNGKVELDGTNSKQSQNIVQFPKSLQESVWADISKYSFQTIFVDSNMG